MDARGNFAYVNAGRPGSVGDSYTYRHSIMFQMIASGEWLAHSPRTISGVNVKPFIVADSAFPLSSTCMKCYEVGQPAYRRSFNYSLIHTRRVVEQAFGQFKWCWKIMDRKCSLRTQCSSDKWQWCVVPCTTFVKDTSANLSQAGFLMKTPTLTPQHLICKWLQ